MTAAPAPNRAERARDELCLAFLYWWDNGLSADAIAAMFGVSRNVPLGVVWRVNRADPTALRRKPETHGR